MVSPRRPYKQHEGLRSRSKRPTLSLAALDAMDAAIAAQLAGEEGEGDCAHVTHASLRAAHSWVGAERARRRAVR